MNKPSILAICAVMTSLISVACGGETPAAKGAEDMAAKTTEVAKAGDAVEFKRLTVEEVEAKVTAGNKGIYVYDNNGEDRYKKGHVPGAKLVSPDAVTTDKLPTDKAALVVFYCGSESCSACHVAAKAAITLGYTNVAIMPEGIAGWEKKGKKTEI